MKFFLVTNDMNTSGIEDDLTPAQLEAEEDLREFETSMDIQSKNRRNAARGRDQRRMERDLD